MKVIETDLEGVVVVEPVVFSDNRGFFMETFHRDRYAKNGIDCDFVQDNYSSSVRGTLRGLHYQLPHTQAKLVQAIKGEILDVVVDIRIGSPSFGRWTGVVLNSENKKQLFIPKGFAHGFAVFSETALFSYKCSDFYSPCDEKGIKWDDPDIGIEWPAVHPILSEKDEKYSFLKDVQKEFLPVYGEI